MSKKRQLIEVEDILTWTEAFNIYQNSVICVVICASHPHRWSDLTQYKLLIIQNARQTPGHAWLEYDLIFRKDAVATGTSDCFRMNFRLCSPLLSTSLPSSSCPSTPVAANWGNNARPPYCVSWNRCQCLWPLGDSRFCYICSSCDGDHPRVRCPFLSPGINCSCSHSPASGGRH